jgi:hypothetical protein
MTKRQCLLENSDTGRNNTVNIRRQLPEIYCVNIGGLVFFVINLRKTGDAKIYLNRKDYCYMSALFEMRDRVLMLPSLENKIADLLEEIRKAEVEAVNLLKQYKQESHDVERIEKKSVSAFLFKATGKYENKKEKKQHAEINAKLAYDRAVTHLNSLVCEKDELVSRILVLQAEKQAYQEELANRRRVLTGQQLTEPKGIQYVTLENERNDILSQIIKIREALNAAVLVKSTARGIFESLSSAEIWATYDVFTRGDPIKHSIKYSHIDRAEKNFHTLASQLQELKTKLNDIPNLTIPELNEISSTQRAIDFWCNNIFTSLSVRRQIKDNTEQIKQLLNNIKTVESTLKSKTKQKETDLEKNRQNEEELLLSIY